MDMRPNCERCDVDLPPSSVDAHVCTYECTFCTACVTRLSNVCPNCGGGFAPRPVRPAREWRPGLSVALRPGSTVRVHTPYTEAELDEFVSRVKDVPPAER